ncbi:hypothetical protein LXL04_008129 [Taraxacum kok-saghyz]
MTRRFCFLEHVPLNSCKDLKVDQTVLELVSNHLGHGLKAAMDAGIERKDLFLTSKLWYDTCSKPKNAHIHRGHDLFPEKLTTGLFGTRFATHKPHKSTKSLDVQKLPCLN